LAYLAIVQPDARAAARITAALGERHRTAVFETWPELERSLANAPPDGCVVDVDHPTREEALSRIRRIRQAHPELAIVAFADLAGEEHELFKLGGLGIDGVLLANPEYKPASIRNAVGRALALARAECVRRALEGRYSPVGVRAVAWAVEHASESPSTETFAAAIGHSSASLARTLRSTDLPSPSRVLLWGRLLQAGAYLARDELTVEEAAFRLGYSTASALSRAMKREIGYRPSEIVQHGGFGFVQEILFPRGLKRRKKRGGPGKVIHSFTLASFAALQSLCPPPFFPVPTGAGAPVRASQAIDQIIDGPLRQVHVGILAVDASDGRTVYARNAQQTFIPASNEKLLVGATALCLLGSDYRYETGLWSSAALVGDTLPGDLILVGTGDPSLSDPTWASGETAMQALADSLSASGVRHVTGALVVDASAWDSTTVGDSWESSDLSESYAATGGVFVLDDGELTVVAAGLRPGEPAQLTWRPEGTADFVTTDVITATADSATDVHAHYLPESRRLVLDGRVQAGHTDTLSFALRDPVRQATAVLARALTERGIQIDAGRRIEWDRGVPVGGDCITGEVASCASAHRMAALRSPPLGDILAITLGNSQNWIAEQLIRTLGAERGERGGWTEGIDVVRSFLTDDVGVDSLDFELRDGSGLSMHDLVTPRAIVHILQYMRSSPQAEIYRDALAEPGEEKSTLEERLEELQGRIWAKTGTLSGVNALSGYLERDDGHEIVFSILSDGSTLPYDTVRDAIDDIVNILSR